MWLNSFNLVSCQFDWLDVIFLDKRHETDRMLLNMMNAAKGHVMVLALVNFVAITPHADSLVMSQVSSAATDDTFSEAQAEPLPRIIVRDHIPSLRLEWHIVAEAKL